MSVLIERGDNKTGGINNSLTDRGGSSVKVHQG